MRLLPGRTFQRGPTVVVKPDADWQGPDTGVLTGHRVIASAFAMEGGRVTEVIRQPDLASALAASGFGGVDRV
jgi:hypothetical protein